MIVMIKYLGTHNSGTSSKLVWWQYPFGFLLHPTSRCQTLSIDEQLESNVRLFNLQVTYYNGEWVFSHGLCIYTGKLYDAINSMIKYASHESPIYFQLRLDNNFFLKHNEDKFKELVNDLKEELLFTNVFMTYALIEKTNEKLYEDVKHTYIGSEHYWSASWSKLYGKTWLDKIPLPKRHAKKYNKAYIENNKADYLMLDFIEYK